MCTVPVGHIGSELHRSASTAAQVHITHVSRGCQALTPLSLQGEVKLADFGVATQGEAPEDAGFDPVGTPYWMAPEVIEMTGSTAPSDIWSVGCLIIELFTGNPPYFDLQPMSALYRIVQDAEVPLPEGITKDLRAFLKRCFQKARGCPRLSTLCSSCDAVFCTC